MIKATMKQCEFHEVMKKHWYSKVHNQNTPQQLPASVWDVCKSILTLSYQVWSPNLVWFLISLWMYRAFPYDLDAAGAEHALLPTSPWILQVHKPPLTIIIILRPALLYNISIANHTTNYTTI